MCEPRASLSPVFESQISARTNPIVFPIFEFVVLIRMVCPGKIGDGEGNLAHSARKLILTPKRLRLESPIREDHEVTSSIIASKVDNETGLLFVESSSLLLLLFNVNVFVSEWTLGNLS